MNVTIDVSFTKEFYLRLWLGKILIRAACYVLGCNVIFETK